MGKVILKNMVFYGYHGAVEQEKILGGRFEVDLELKFDMSKAIKTGHLEDTINYEEVYKTVHDVVTNSQYYLLEKLAGKIMEIIFKSFNVDSVKINLRKPNAPLKGVLDYVEVELEYSKNDFFEKMKGLNVR
ncbi:MAG: dihydroneopterin aldolase [Candidatus Marinimicrobia bacterium]|nr:dihydroneopterin aldolase [Candidatus Neomarinimicrobiota bacterium]